jgi:hypothetical protein
MPMLHGCAFPGCCTLTLSAYCVEHELLIRAVKESERQHEHETAAAADALPGELAVEGEAPEPASL